MQQLPARHLVQVGCVCVTLGHATNNVAEYRGLLAGLQAARDLGVRRLLVTGDSMLVVNQASSSWGSSGCSVPRAEQCSLAARRRGCR